MFDAFGRPPVPDLVVPRAILPFHLDERPVRGRLVRLGPLADALLSRHDYQPAIAQLSGEAMALTAGLAAALKFEGSFSLQAKGDGPVSLFLADCTNAGGLRGYAKVNPERLVGLEALNAAALLGKGYLAFTCDQGPDMDRYQGIVAIEGETLTDMTGAYFRNSEQLDTYVKLACAETPNGWRASALLMERVAGAGWLDKQMDQEQQQEAWQTATILARTISNEELLDDTLSGEQLLHRLFHAEGLRLDRPKPLSYGCRCSRERLLNVLGGFSTDDLDHMADAGAITMTCEFCNYDFRFDRNALPAREAGN
ncbi:MAG: Hsp33 family molecular chaperone HslO [Roseomonas sp.]|nr:Hsp33 family molecular chaperone HslO [Roseomonas sp.]